MSYFDDKDKETARIQKRKKIKKFLDFLEVPYHTEPMFGLYDEVDAEVLYDLLMDEEKLKTLVSKLKLKAFW